MDLAIIERLRTFKHLQEAKTTVHQHVSHSKSGKAFNVRQHEREVLPRNDEDLGDKLQLGHYAGGTQGARHATDPKTGTKYIVKGMNYSDPDRVSAEVLSAAVYKKLGVYVPEVTRSTIDGKPVSISRLVSGTHKSKIVSDKQLQAGFMTDVFVGNWDVVGLEYDNILYGQHATRVDLGSSFLWRAQGGAKAYPGKPVEHETFLNSDINRQSATAFGGVSHSEMTKQAREIGKLSDQWIDAAVEAAKFRDKAKAKIIAQAMKGRRDWMKSFGRLQEVIADVDAYTRILKNGTIVRVKRHPRHVKDASKVHTSDTIMSGEINLTKEELAQREVHIKALSKASSDWIKKNVPSGKPNMKDLANLSEYLGKKHAKDVDGIANLMDDRTKYINRPAVYVDIPNGPSLYILGWRDRPGDIEGTEIHDHANSQAGVYVHKGVVTERLFGVSKKEFGGESLAYKAIDRELTQGGKITVTAPYIHEVYDVSDENLSVTIHSYYPPLKEMSFYQVKGDKLLKTGHWKEDNDKLAPIKEHLLAFKLLQEKTTNVKQHVAHSKKGKAFIVKQHDRSVKDFHKEIDTTQYNPLVGWTPKEKKKRQKLLQAINHIQLKGMDGKISKKEKAELFRLNKEIKAFDEAVKARLKAEGKQGRSYEDIVSDIKDSTGHKAWRKKLTHSEHNAINDYVEDSTTLNDFLRYGGFSYGHGDDFGLEKPDKSDYDLKDKYGKAEYLDDLKDYKKDYARTVKYVQKQTTSIDSALKKAKINSDVYVYRGLSKRYIKKQKIKKGRKFIDFGFGSTSFSKDTAKSFGGFLMRIKLPKGTRAGYLGHVNDDEHELLLPRGAKFRATKIGHNYLEADYYGISSKTPKKLKLKPLEEAVNNDRARRFFWDYGDLVVEGDEDFEEDFQGHKGRPGKVGGSLPKNDALAAYKHEYAGLKAKKLAGTLSSEEAIYKKKLKLQIKALKKEMGLIKPKKQFAKLKASGEPIDFNMDQDEYSKQDKAIDEVFGYHDWHKSLTKEEEYKVKDYIDSSTGLNYFLRHKKVYGKFDETDYPKYIRGLDSALSKSTVTNPVYVYRGISEKFFKAHGKSSKYVDLGYGSSSLNREKAKAFGEFVLRIKLPAGTKAGYVAGFGDGSYIKEREVIIPRGAKYRITKHDPVAKYAEGEYYGTTSKSKVFEHAMIIKEAEAKEDRRKRFYWDVDDVVDIKDGEDDINEDSVEARILPFKLLQEKYQQVKAYQKNFKGEVVYVRSYTRYVNVNSVETTSRIWHGEPIDSKVISKQKTGDIGEALTLHIKGGMPLNQFLDRKEKNLAFDVINLEKRKLYEVKAGLASVGYHAKDKYDGMKWRLTKGEPKGSEKKKLKKMSASVKLKYNAIKDAAIMDRKLKMWREVERLTGKKFEVKTITYIVNPSTKKADMYEFGGLHKEIRWRSAMAQAGYKRSLKWDS